MTESYAHEPTEHYAEIQDRRHNFTIIDNEIIDLIPELGRTAFTVYCILARFANRDREAWPSLDHLARLAKVKVRTIQETAHALEAFGLLKIEQRREKGRFTRNCYTLLEVNRARFPTVAVNTGYGNDTVRSMAEEEEKQTDSDSTVLPSTVLNRSAQTAIGSERHTNKTYSSLKQDLQKEKSKERAREENLSNEEERRQKPLDIVDDRVEYCHAGRNGECTWADCPQARDDEPAQSGRWQCPLEAPVDTLDTLSYSAGSDGEPRLVRPEEEDWCGVLSPYDGEQCRLSPGHLAWSNSDGHHDSGVGQRWSDTIPIDALDADDPPLVTTEDCALHFDPAFPCNHLVPALHVLESVLNRKLYAHRHLHTFVHSHELGDVLKVAQHFTAHEPDRSKWTVGLMFAPDNAEARLQAVQTPVAGVGPTRDPSDLSRYDKPRTYEKPMPEPPPEDERLAPEEVKELLADVHKAFNTRSMA